MPAKIEEREKNIQSVVDWILGLIKGAFKPPTGEPARFVVGDVVFEATIDNVEELNVVAHNNAAETSPTETLDRFFCIKTKFSASEFEPWIRNILPPRDVSRRSPARTTSKEEPPIKTGRSEVPYN